MTEVTDTATTQTEVPVDTGATTAAPDAAATTEGAQAEESILGDAGAGEAELAADPAAEAPTVPEKYELTAPEGMTLDPESLAEAEPVFRELGLSNEAAQKLIPVATKFAERIATQSADAANQAILNEVVEQRKAWATEAKSDPEIGGSKWDETLELSAKALDALGYPKGSLFRSFLTDSGLANHPEMIRCMRKVGALVSEDGDFLHGDTGAPVKADRLSALYPNDVPNKGANQ